MAGRPGMAARSLGRSPVDLVSTLHELDALDVGFVSLCDVLDLTTPSGSALTGMLAVFADNAELCNSRNSNEPCYGNERRRVWLLPAEKGASAGVGPKLAPQTTGRDQKDGFRRENRR